MTSMTSESSEYFRQVAGEWDTIRAGYFGEAVRESAIEKAYLRPEMAVADVGAGTGFMAAGLAPLVKQVYVVDGSAEMLDVARKNLAGFTNVEYHQADGASLPFPDESLDAVFANMYLHHCVDPLAAIREMVRVLRPAGRLVITDMDAHPYAWLKEEMADVWQGFERSQVREWYRQADLVNVVIDCTGQSCCAQSGNAAQVESECAGSSRASISVFVAAGTRRVAMREQVRASYGAQAEGKACCSADAAGQSCDCSGDCCTGSSEEMTWATGYSPSELAEVPGEAASFSLGCGNPTAMANLRAGEVVLDIGSGGGLDSFIAAGKVGPEGHVIGVDMTPAMLERARGSAIRNGITNVEFRQGYAENLPVEDGSIDVILSNCVINLSEDKGQVFREAFRALKPGGRLEVSDVVSAGPLPFEAQMDETGWAGCIGGALPEREYLDLVSQAGFEQIASRRSVSDGSVAGVPVYSVIVSARKPV